MSDDRRTPEQQEIDAAAKAGPKPPSRTEPCRRYVDVPAVSAEEIAEFAERIAPRKDGTK